MATINQRQVWIGAVAGGVVFTLWSLLVNIFVLGPRYQAAQAEKLLLEQPRYVPFLLFWIIVLFVLSVICAWFYAHIRNVRPPGPRTALLVGIFVGFAAGFPLSFTLASWSPLSRVIPLYWMLDLWFGCVLASLVAGWLYKE